MRTVTYVFVLVLAVFTAKATGLWFTQKKGKKLILEAGQKYNTHLKDMLKHKFVKKIGNEKVSILRKSYSETDKKQFKVVFSYHKEGEKKFSCVTAEMTDKKLKVIKELFTKNLVNAYKACGLQSAFGAGKKGFDKETKHYDKTVKKEKKHEDKKGKHTHKTEKRDAHYKGKKGSGKLLEKKETKTFKSHDGKHHKKSQHYQFSGEVTSTDGSEVVITSGGR